MAKIKSGYDFLPTWEDCVKAVENKTADDIERFIYENEPAGRKEENRFRRELCACLNAWVNRRSKGQDGGFLIHPETEKAIGKRGMDKLRSSLEGQSK